MPTIRSRSWVAAPIDEVFAFFDDPGNLAGLMPPPVRIRLVRVEPAPPRAGSVIEFRYGLGPLQRSWVVRLVDRVPGERIVDETLAGPVAGFHHSHVFIPARSGGTWIFDRIDYHVGHAPHLRLAPRQPAPDPSVEIDGRLRGPVRLRTVASR